MGYIRRNVCVPLPRVKSLDELNAKLLAKCTQYLNHQIEGRPDKVGVMLSEDQAALQPMPRYTPDISKKVYPRLAGIQRPCSKPITIPSLASIAARRPR